MHIGCSAPETMHLCEKFGYDKISEVIYEKEYETIETFGKVEEIMPNLKSKEITDKFRGTTPRLEYWVKIAEM